ncbi:hypothetical protein FPOAC2_13005 [Fusarium poae]|uniref:hypothetical protein n=1 Tax=Fusarium poae TaxID=36050 RepID=UPI001CE7A6B6|nr:hypothetical protein FPOAC1_012646 [Fusarium poae]KAG8667807.1 hypothetical protein FPOAC1_012646 [Fusarium poae]
MDNDTEPLEGSQSSTSGYGSRDDVGRIPPAQRYLRRDSLTEISNRPRTQGSLNVLDVFSLIVNKMVGTGIFTAPASVFLMTGNRITTLCLFFAGFLYTIVSMAIYLNYAKVLPFNGGELVYIDEITSSYKASGSRRSRFFGDGLLAYIIYAIAFVLFFNSSTNALQAGRMILIVAKPEKDEVDHHLMRFIGVFCLSLICLLQYFSPTFGRGMNKVTAVGKVFMLLGIFIVGLIAACQSKSKEKWEDKHEIDDSTKHEKGVLLAKALLTVLFSFQGWENATFVTGQISADRHSTLRNGFLIAVFTVGSLYIVITAVFLQAVEWDNLVKKEGDSTKTTTNYTPLFNKKSETAPVAWAAVTAMSALGNLNAIIYTFSRVKQAIGQAEILPWSRFWKQDDILQREENEFYNKSPQGGLIIHWIMSVALILVTIGIEDTGESVSFPGYIQTYIHCAILAFLGLGFFNLDARETSLWPEDSDHRRNLSSAVKYIFYAIVPVYVFLNLATMVVTVLKPYKTIGGTSSNAVPGWVYLLITGLIILIGTAYYILFFGAVRRTYRLLPARANGTTPAVTTSSVNGILEEGSRWNLMRWAGVKCEMIKDDGYNVMVPRVYRFGRRWRLVYSLPGDVVEMNDVGQGPTQEQMPPSLTWMEFRYWLFGGTRLTGRLWERMKRWPEQTKKSR